MAKNKFLTKKLNYLLFICILLAVLERFSTASV